MKHYGHIDLNKNELQNAVIPLDTSFPTSPKVGQLVFKNQILYICVAYDGDLPVWVPLTNEINTYIHVQDTSSATWTVSHPLKSGSVQVQVFDTSNRMVIPNEITLTDKNTVTIEFGIAFTGKAILMIGNVEGGTRPDYGFEHIQTSLASEWTINHGLGHYPIVRVFIGTEEVQPSQIIHDTVNTCRVIFTSPYVGSAKLI